MSGSTPASICHATKFRGSSARCRWKCFIATVPAAQPKPDSTAHSFDARLPCHAHGSTTSTRPTNAAPTASHSVPRTRSCSTGHAISSVQNGIVNTSTEVRPAPPLARAIVVAPKLIVVWKNPVTMTGSQSVGQNGWRRHSITANSVARPSSVRCRLKLTGSDARDGELHHDPVRAPQEGEQQQGRVGTTHVPGRVAHHSRRKSSIARATASG